MYIGLFWWRNVCVHLFSLLPICFLNSVYILLLYGRRVQTNFIAAIYCNDNKGYLI